MEVAAGMEAGCRLVAMNEPSSECSSRTPLLMALRLSLRRFLSPLRHPSIILSIIMVVLSSAR